MLGEPGCYFLNSAWVLTTKGTYALFLLKNVRMKTDKLLHQELSILLGTEIRQAIILPRVAESIRSQKLERVLRLHITAVNHQVDRLRQVGAMLDVDLKEEVSDKIEDLIGDLQSILDEQSFSATRDELVVTILQEIKDVEIAGYGQAYQYARTLDYVNLCELLDATQQEEKNAKMKLGNVAATDLNARVGKVHAKLI